MEVILGFGIDIACSLSILHVCGGDPAPSSISWTSKRYSPRMWRWSHSQKVILHAVKVFSTYVEVILVPCIVGLLRNRILHVCGGDPKQAGSTRYIWRYSPRMWRWSSYNRTYALEEPVFSTYVEVILLLFLYPILFLCILHVCGGDPQRIG